MKFSRAILVGPNIIIAMGVYFWWKQFFPQEVLVPIVVIEELVILLAQGALLGAWDRYREDKVITNVIYGKKKKVYYLRDVHWSVHLLLSVLLFSIPITFHLLVP